MALALVVLFAWALLLLPYFSVAWAQLQATPGNKTRLVSSHIVFTILL